jgi:transcriptional regulator GlxA family with amidase domain
LALPGVIPFELSIPGRVFGAAVDSGGRALYQVQTCSLDGEPVMTSLDFGITVEHDAAILGSADTVLIPASESLGEIRDRGTLPAAVADAMVHTAPGARLVSICLGAYVLASAGLLDGRPATTHWKHADHFARLFPRVDVDPRVLFVDDGDVCTSAGAAAGVDMCLHLVRRDHGSAIANAVARLCVVPPARHGGQAQYIEHPVPATTEMATEAARAHALADLSRSLSVPELAISVNMSTRTFTRRFRRETDSARHGGS